MDEIAQIEETKSDSDFDIDSQGTVNNFKNMGLYNMGPDGQIANGNAKNLKDNFEKSEDFWMV